MACVTERAGKPPAIVVIVLAPAAPGIAVMACATQLVTKTPTIARSIVGVRVSAGMACATFANTTIARAAKNAERAPEEGLTGSTSALALVHGRPLHESKECGCWVLHKYP